MMLSHGLSLEFMAVASLIVLLASAVQATTGFGFSIVAVPPLTFVLGVREGIVVSLTLSLLTSLALSWRTMQLAERDIGRPIIASGVAGLVPGLAVFRFVDVRLLKVTIAVVVISAALVLAFGLTPRLRACRRNGLISGLASGFLSGSVGLGGPPVTLYLAGLSLDKEVYRATASRYFAALYLVLVPAQLILSPSLDALLRALLLLPAVAVGGWLGHRVFPRLSPLWFNRVVVLVVLAAGLTSLVSAR